MVGKISALKAATKAVHSLTKKAKQAMQSPEAVAAEMQVREPAALCSHSFDPATHRCTEVRAAPSPDRQSSAHPSGDLTATHLSVRSVTPPLRQLLASATAPQKGVATTVSTSSIGRHRRARIWCAGQPPPLSLVRRRVLRDPLLRASEGAQRSTEVCGTHAMSTTRS